MPTLSDLILGKTGSQPGPWDRLKDTWLHAAVNSPLGAEGLARAWFKHKGYNDQQINSAINSLNKDYSDKYAQAPVIQGVRPGHPLDYVSPDNIGRGAVTLLGSVLGGVDPTYAVGGVGKGAVQRIAHQAVTQAGASVVRQQVEKDTGQRQHIDARQVARDATMGAVFQGGAEALSGARNAFRGPDNINLSTDIVPYEKPTVNDDGSPKMGQFASPKDAAMHMRANGFTQASHDIVAHGDDSFSVVPKAPANITPEDFNEVPQSITPDDMVGDNPQAPATQEAPLAPDGFPGNGSVPPIDPQMLAKIMGNHDDLANLPTIGPEDMPEETSENVLQFPTPDPVADKPIVDNTGYEAHTPYVGTPQVPANDQPAADISDRYIDPDTRGFHKDLLAEIQRRAELARQNEQDFHDEAQLPFQIGDQFHTPKSAENGEDPWTVVSHYRDPKDPNRYGYRVSRGNGEEQQTMLVSDPKTDEKLRQYNPDWNRAKHVSQWQNLTNPVAHKVPKDDDFSPAREEITAQPGVNARRMAKMLGPQLYGDPTNMGEVSVKEVLQNSFDAIKEAMAKHGLEQGKIDINTNRDAREITMHDNGIGMAPETLGGKFLQIAGTGKEGDNASGGFGIAKMLFLYGNKNLHVKTMRDGKVSELHTTGEQLFDALEDPAHAPKIQVREPTDEDHADFPHGHGTKIKLTIPSHFKDPATGEDSAIDFPNWETHSLNHSPMFANIKVNWNHLPVRGVGSDFPTQDYNQFAHVQFGWGKADIYVSNDPTHKHGNNVHVLSNGLHQFSQKLGKTPGDPWSDPLPYRFYIDLHPKVKPEDAGYPFTFNRQGLTDTARKELHGVMDYIQKLYAHKVLGNSAKSFGSMFYIDPNNGEPSDPVDLKPDMPVTTDGFRGIQQGDEVAVKDGRMLVNGKELPAMTPEELKNSVPSHKELLVNPSLIDPTRIMVHDNSVVHDGMTDEQSLIEHMREKFPEEFDHLLGDSGQIFVQLRDMVAELDPSYHDLMNQAIGISFDPTYRGVSIRVPFSGSFVNPLAPRGDTPREMGAAILGTMIHELAHFKVRSHNADFPAEMQLIHAKLYGNEEFPKWFEQAVKDLAGYKEVIEYGRNLFDKEYVKARSDSFKDGVRDDRPEGNDEGPVDGVSRAGDAGPSAEGIPEGAAQEYPSIEPRDTPRKGPGSRSKDPVLRKLADVLEQGRPLRQANSEAISKQRGERIRAAYAARAQKGGREGLYAELAALKGEMSKARIQPIAHHFTPEEIDHIFDIVKNNPKLAGYDSINAQKALDKLFGEKHGELPTEGELKLLQKALPHSVIRALMNDESGSAATDWLSKYANPVAEIAGIPRALKTIGDFGVAFRQAVPLIGTKAYWKSIPEIFKGVSSEKMYQQGWETITSDPDYYWMQVGKVAFSHLEGHNLSEREEFAPSKLAEKFPLVRRSERGFTGYLNMIRYHTFKRLLQAARDLGVDPTSDTDYVKAIGDYTNTMTGRGSLGKTGDRAAPFLASMFFSPRLAASRIKLFYPPFYIKLPRQLQVEAMKSFLAYATYMGVVLGIAAGLGAAVELDPKSTNFARITTRDTHFDPTGGFQPYVRTFWQFVTGEKKNDSGEIQKLGSGFGQPTRLDLVTNFVEGKASPNAAFVMDLMRGSDFKHPRSITGEVNTFDQHGKDDWYKNPAANLAVPMGVEAFLEANSEYGPKSPIPYAAAMAETFGIGANTYEPRVKKNRSSSKNEFEGGFSKDDFKSDFGKDQFQ